MTWENDKNETATQIYSSFSCRQSGFEKTEDLSEKRFVLESKRLTYKGTICEAAFFKLLIAIGVAKKVINVV